MADLLNRTLERIWILFREHTLGQNYNHKEIDAHISEKIIFELNKEAFTTKRGASAPTEALRQIGTSATMLEPILQFSQNTQNDVYFIMHMPPNVGRSIKVGFHLMWLPGTGWAAGNYNWKLEYIVKNRNDDSTIGASIIISEDVTPDNANDFIETEFDVKIDAGAEQTISCHLYRDVANDNGDDTGDIRFVEKGNT